ncbi:uncharacterized protein METZ01_LOCUS459388, partial [marine metagenome]
MEPEQQPALCEVSRVIVKLGTGVLAPTPGEIDSARLRSLGEA